MRKLKDNIAVSEVFGTILMMVIVVPLVGIFGVTFTNMMITQRTMIDAQLDAMHRFIDYLNNLTFNPTARNNINGIVIDDGHDSDTWESINGTVIDDGLDDIK